MTTTKAKYGRGVYRLSGGSSFNMGARATYLYCVIQAHRPRATRTASGLPGLGRPRLVNAGPALWLVVADAPQPQYSEASIARGLRDLEWVSKCAVAHEAVVESWLGARALVPMKLFTIFESDERALAHIRRQQRKLDRVIERVAGKWEWGVRVRQSNPPGPSRPTARAASGAGYLAGKKEAWDAARERASRGQARADAVFAALAAQAAEADRRPPPADSTVKSNLLLDAAFLVGVSRKARFQAAARRFARDLKDEGYSVELTGPWPPYNFVGL